MGCMLLVLLLFKLSLAIPSPIVLMHGLLATPEAMTHVEKWITSDPAFTGVHIHNVALFPNSTHIKEDTLLVNINEQVRIFAENVKGDSKLFQGFHIIAHSQGALLARAYIQKYSLKPGYPPVKNFISYAGPHDGVFGVPDFNYICPDNTCPWVAELFSDLINDPSLSYVMQDFLTFAAYWKDIYNLDEYLSKNIFLADINNEKATRNASYVEATEKLERVLLVNSPIDEIVVPNVSPQWGFFPPNNDSAIVLFQQSAQYRDNLLGYATLYNSSRLGLVSVHCRHADMPRDVCKSQIWPLTRPYLL